jgi:hypothetical protein
MRIVKWFGCLWAAGLAGCSLYPIPDDVVSIPTEDIVRHARCEIRSEIIAYLIEHDVVAPSASDKEIAVAVGKIKKNKNSFLAMLVGVGSAYTFTFEIDEANNANGMAEFSLPFRGPLNGGQAKASVDLKRKGKREFATGDTWDDLLINHTRCAGVRPRPGNIVYPLGGSIGVGRAVRTFIDILDQAGKVGGAKWEAEDSFVDTLTFTTEVKVGADALITLAPVPHSFRLLSASAGLSGSRKDFHQLQLSLAFPHPLDPATSLANTGAKFMHSPFQRPPQWRARYNLCVQDGRQREDAVKLVRLEAPEVYCITFADAFEPKPGLAAGAVRQPPAQQPGQPSRAAPPSGGTVRGNRL